MLEDENVAKITFSKEKREKFMRHMFFDYSSYVLHFNIIKKWTLLNQFVQQSVQCNKNK